MITPPPLPTFGEEGRHHEAEHDGSDGVEQQEHEDQTPVAVDEDAALAQVYVQEEGDDGHRNEDEHEVLDKPCRPV